MHHLAHICLSVAKRLCQLRVLMLCVVLFASLGQEAMARPIEGYDINRPPPNFSGQAGEADSEAPPGVDENGAFTYYQNNYRVTTVNGNKKNDALKIICAEGYLTERVVMCIRRIVDSSVQTFLTTFEESLNAYILGLVILAVTLFGGQILMGTVEKPGSAAFTLLLKIGAVLLFTEGLGGFVPAIFPVMESLSGYAMSYISDSAQSPFLASCGEAGGFVDVSIWRRVDCILGRLFTGEDSATGGDANYRVGVLWVLAVAVFWTTFLGFFVFLVMCAVFIMIFLLVIRCVYVFLAAYTFLALLIIISPLIIPLVLFKSTANYFNKWWRQFLSMLIQPMILFAYMSFVFALIDAMFFKDEEYSLARILGTNWETPEVVNGLSEEARNDKVEEFMEEYDYLEDDPETAGYRRYLEENLQYMSIGIVLLEEEALVNIEVNIAGNIADRLPDIPVVGRAIDVGADALDAIAEWGLGKVRDTLIPFHVMRIKPEGRTRWSFMMDLLKFFLIVLIFMPLLIKYTADIPRLIQALSSAIRTPGSVMPGEKQVMGTIGAVKQGTRGAVEGAVAGFVTGGKKGAVAGAAEGGARGVRRGYSQGSGDHSAKRHGGGLAGNEHGDNIHAKQGQGLDRKVMMGEGGGRLGGKAKSFATDAASAYVTRGKGGGGKGGGKGGAGK